MELFYSKEVYQVINDELVPISITTKSIEKYKSQQLCGPRAFKSKGDV